MGRKGWMGAKWWLGDIRVDGEWVGGYFSTSLSAQSWQNHDSPILIE